MVVNHSMYQYRTIPRTSLALVKTDVCDQVSNRRRYNNISEQVNALISYTICLPFRDQINVYTLPCIYSSLHFELCGALMVTFNYVHVSLCPPQSYHVVFPHFQTRTFDGATSTKNIYIYGQSSQCSKPYIYIAVLIDVGIALLKWF